MTPDQITQQAIAMLDECVDRLSECAVEIGNLSDPVNPVCKRARATMKAVAEACGRWQKASEPLPPCKFCGRNCDLCRALDIRICAICWNDGLRLTAERLDRGSEGLMREVRG